MKNIRPNIIYIGTDHLDLDLFESQYAVPDGVSYNSYLIEDEKIAVMDTVDAHRGDEWLSLLEEALHGRQPDYLVMHHMEPDHSGMAAAFAARYPGATILASAMGLKFLRQFAPEVDFKTQAVKEGDVIGLGRGSLRFVSAPMVHWPEVMVSLYDGVLFSADAFGKFGALSRCGFFSDEDPDWATEARRYYFNICGKYGPQVQALLNKLSTVPELIAPLHGPVLKGDLSPYLHLYQRWSSYEAESEGVFIACASIHGCTREAALKLADILTAKGCPKVALRDLTRDDTAGAVAEAFRYPRAVFAASTYDAGLFTPAYNFLHTLQTKGWCRRRVALVENGSWAPAAAKVMTELLSQMKEIELCQPAVSLRGTCKEADIPALEALADAILA